MNVGKSFLWLVVFLLCAHASLLPKLSHAQEATSGVIPLATMEPGEPEQRLREFFEGDYDVRQETWDYPSADEPKIVRCNSVHSMGVDGFVLFVRNECQDGTRFLGLHSFDRRVNKYFNPGFSNGGGYVGGMYAEFQSDGSRYVSNAPTTDPLTGEAIQSRYVAELNDDGYVFEYFLVRNDGTEFMTLRHTYIRTK